MSKHDFYFVKQRLLGIATLLFGIWSVHALDGNGVVFGLLVPVSFVLILSKRMWLVNDYYFEVKDSKKRNKRS